MNVTKYICLHIISFLGFIGLIVLMCFIALDIFVYPDYNFICGFVASLAIKCFNVYFYIIPILVILLPIEFLLHKLTHNKFLLNIPLKNKSIICTYYILFWLGIISSILYLIGYLWFVSKLTP